VQNKTTWFVYILRCADDTLYTGITTDIARRVDEHNQGKKSANYTRARRPVELVYSEPAENRSQASMREYTIKQLNREEKHQLCGLPS
jgi:putative endonuclease